MSARRTGSTSGRAPAPHRRFAERAAQVRRRPWRLAAALGSFLAVLAGVVYLVGFSPAFVVEDVVVEGVGDGRAEQVRELAEVPLGHPLARVDTEAVAARIEERDPRVAAATVGRSWPSTVTVDVTLRTPALVVQQSGEPLRVADTDGVVYDDVGERPEGVPQVRVPRGEIDPAAVHGALAAYQALAEPVRDQLTGMRLHGAGTLELSLGAVDVAWGPPEHPEQKARVLEALLQHDSIDPDPDEGDTQEPIRIDLSVPDTPVVTGLPPVES